MTTATKPVTKSGYLNASRSPRYSILFALPLLLAYEALAAALATPGQGELRNGADAILRAAFTAVAGVRGPLVFMTSVILLGVFLVARDLKRSKDRLRGRVFVAMLGESMLLAAAFGIVIGTLTANLLGSL